jgi:hypothetical protein
VFSSCGSNQHAVVHDAIRVPVGVLACLEMSIANEIGAMHQTHEGLRDGG